jgi:hypothetical protein
MKAVDYEPENCTWIALAEQAKNQQRSKPKGAVL